MKVRFSESGGFAGLVKECRLDTDRMPPAEGRELERLVKASGISASGEFFSKSGRDLRQYEVGIDAAGASRIAAVFDDETLPPSARPLIGFLRKHARP